jgi:hypothetical protein
VGKSPPIKERPIALWLRVIEFPLVGTFRPLEQAGHFIALEPLVC